MTLQSSPDDVNRTSAENENGDRDHVEETHDTVDGFNILRASTNELLLWQNNVYSSANYDGLDVSGPTADAVADALLSLLKSHKLSTPFVPPEGVVCEKLPLGSFSQRWHNIRM